MKDFSLEDVQKIKRLSALTEKLESHILDFDEFTEFKSLLAYFKIADEEQLEKKMKGYGFENSKEFVNINFNYLNQPHEKRLNTSSAIGYLTGITQSYQMKYIKSYEEFKKNKK